MPQPDTDSGPSSDASSVTDHLDVLVIGAGFSGVCAGIKLLEQGITNFRIFEKSQGVGGTWYENRYPGAACDVPSHFYCYSFEPNPDWSRVYSPQAEIQQYVEYCVDKYGLRDKITHGARIVELRLDEMAGNWRVTFGDDSVVTAHHVINGGGGLHKPHVPDFQGRETFSGPSMHTADWDHSVRLEDKRIAIIGSAASAIQVIPEVAKIAKQVTVFQRTPNYIAQRNDRTYTDRQRARFRRWPWLQRLYRWLIFNQMDVLLFPITRKNSLLGRAATRRVLKHMRDSVDEPALRKVFEPDYALGCKRILLSDDLWDAVNRDNVVVETESIERIVPNGIETADGVLHEADLIVYATGFDIDGHMRSINVIGMGELELQEVWSDAPEAFCGGCVAGFPNYWMITGPNTGVATTSVVYMVEQMVRFILRMIAAAGAEKLLSVRQGVQDAYNDELQTLIEQRVWSEGCNSWYVNESGRVTTLYPKNARAFRRQLERVNLSSFEVMEANAKKPTMQPEQVA